MEVEKNDSYLNRWIQPDSIIPDPGNPIDLDRYAYVRNNPIRHSDPSGHNIWNAVSDFTAGFVAETLRTNFGFIPQVQEALTVNPAESDATLAGRIVGDVVNIAGGAVVSAAGFGMATGGSVVLGAGTAGVGAVAAFGVGGAAMVAGGAVAINGGANLGQNLALMKGRAESSGFSFQKVGQYGARDVQNKGFHVNYGNGEVTIKPKFIDPSDPRVLE